MCCARLTPLSALIFNVLLLRSVEYESLPLLAALFGNPNNSKTQVDAKVSLLSVYVERIREKERVVSPSHFDELASTFFKRKQNFFVKKANVEIAR